MGDYKSILKKRYERPEMTESDRILLMFMCDIPAERGFEEEMDSWLKENPNASLQDVAAYENTFLEPLEIVDDDEAEDE